MESEQLDGAVKLGKEACDLARLYCRACMRAADAFYEDGDKRSGENWRREAARLKRHLPEEEQVWFRRA